MNGGGPGSASTKIRSRGPSTGSGSESATTAGGALILPDRFFFAIDRRREERALERVGDNGGGPGREFNNTVAIASERRDSSVMTGGAIDSEIIGGEARRTRRDERDETRVGLSVGGPGRAFKKIESRGFGASSSMGRSRELAVSDGDTAGRSFVVENRRTGTNRGGAGRPSMRDIERSPSWDSSGNTDTGGDATASAIASAGKTAHGQTDNENQRENSRDTHWFQNYFQSQTSTQGSHSCWYQHQGQVKQRP